MQRIRQGAGKHWRGEYPLGHSFWVSGALWFSVLFLVVLPPLGALGEQLEASQSIGGGITLFGVTMLCVSVGSAWWLIGLWRCCGHQIREHRRYFWPLLTGVLVLVQGLGLLLASAWWIQGVMGMGWLYTQRDEYQITHLDERRLKVEGMISDIMAAELQQTLAASPNVRLLVLESPGGMVQAAMDIIALVEERKLVTFVQGDCASACSYIFLAGGARVLDAEGKLGFHQMQLAGFGRSTEGTLNKDESAIETYMMKRGVTQRFAKLVKLIGHDNMWYPDTEELATNGVITHVHQAETTPRIMPINRYLARPVAGRG